MKNLRDHMELELLSNIPRSVNKSYYYTFDIHLMKIDVSAVLIELLIYIAVSLKSQIKREIGKYRHQYTFCIIRGGCKFIVFQFKQVP